MEESREPTPAGTEIPLFEPEDSPPPPYRQPSVPTANMATPDSPPTPQPEQQAEHPVRCFIAKLQELEDAAKAEMTAWGPAYLGQVDESAATQAAACIKRKGVCSSRIIEYC